MLPGDRVLIAEYPGRVVTERNLQGEILWSKSLDVPVVFAQRLPNGNTFLVARNRVVELNGSGKEVFCHRRQRRDLVAARPCYGGGAVLLTDAGVCVFLDGQGKEASRFATGTSRCSAPVSTYCPTSAYWCRTLPATRWWNTLPMVGFCGRCGRCVRPAFSVCPVVMSLVTSTTTREVVELDRQGQGIWRRSFGQCQPRSGMRR